MPASQKSAPSKPTLATNPANSIQATIPAAPPTITLLAIILFSGACWWLSFDLHLHWWWPIWLAPIPILYILPALKGRQAFLITFLALLIGRCSWLSYLLSVLPLIPALLFTLLLPLCFALLILPVRKLMLTRPPIIAALAFPILWTTFEFSTFLLTRDGTIASFAYTQYDLLPLMQLASLTGILGITFLISFIPSVLAVYAQRKQLPYGLVIAILPTLLVLIFGLFRLNEPNDNPPLSVAMVSIAEKNYRNDHDPSSEKERQLANQYLMGIEKLASQGAQIILLPEKVIPVTDSMDQPISDSFRQTAARLHITIIAGYTKINSSNFENQARVFTPQGAQQLNYLKVNLFEGEAMANFIAGKTPGLFNLTPSPTNNPISSTQTTPSTPSTTEVPFISSGGATPSIPSGVAICKDLDFHQYIRTYGLKTTLLFVPAWDFDRDGWYHSRIALTRGIENGYSIARNGRQGRLTLSDDKGRILAEANSEKGNDCNLIGRIQPAERHTFYSRSGDWFAWLNLAAALILLLAAAKAKITTNHSRSYKTPSSAPHNAPRSPAR